MKKKRRPEPRKHMFNTYKKPPIVKVGHFSLKALTKNSSKKDLQSYQRAKINYRFIKKIPGKRENSKTMRRFTSRMFVTRS